MTTTYVSVDELARKHNLSKEVLVQLIEAGVIETHETPSGELLVVAKSNDPEPETKGEIIAQKFAHLQGQVVNAYAAQQEYGIRYQNFIKWARSGYIKILNEEEGRLVEMDAADVAYCAYVYEQKKEEYGGNVAGVRIFDEYGNPYQLKYPDVAQMRFERRQKRAK